MKTPRARRALTWDSLEDRAVPSLGGSPTTTPALASLSILGTSPATTPTQRTDVAAVQAHAAAVALADSGGASGVVFYGDSITARWDEPGYPGLSVWNSEIAPLGAVAFGVDGDRTQNLIWRLGNGELDGAPRVAVIEIGTNNLIFSGQNETPQEAADGIQVVVATIQAVSPTTRILLLGILPRSESPSDPVRAEIQQVNSMISGVANGTSVVYLDLGSLFLRPDGTIPSDLLPAPDFLHPNTAGYQLMADAMQAPIAALLGVAPPDPTTYGGPVLVDMPPDQTAVAADPRGALLSYPLPLAFDALDPSSVITSDPPRGTVLPLGMSVVTCTATDRYGHTASASFSVMVNPDVPPVLNNIPPDQVVEATSRFGAVVTFPVPGVSDASDANVNVLCFPPSGSTFPLGTTVVTCTGTDQVGNVARATFTINVRDTTPPAIVAPDLEVEATGPGGADVGYTQLRVTDVADPDPSFRISVPSGANFPIGTTPVTCTAMDRSGNVSFATFVVTVQDTPILHNAPSSLVVQASNRAGSVVKFTPPAATDVADPGVQVVVSRPSGSLFPLGTTVVTCLARGLSGATATATFTVSVVPRKIVGSVSSLAQSALARFATALGDSRPLRAGTRGKPAAVSYGPAASGPGALISRADTGLVSFLTSVDTNRDSQVTLQEMMAFLSSDVDLNHDGRVSLYEEAFLQLHDPQASPFLFPGG
jgi:lysophospholipase L1-like esterase